MNELIRNARRSRNMTQDEVARRLFISDRLYRDYESGEKVLSPEMALKLSKIIDCPALTMVYCRKRCAIGKRYCYDVLNNVDLSPTAILTKYRQEETEAHEALENMAILLLNKQNREDFSEAELKELWKWALEMLDLEHVIETLKLQLWNFIDVAELVRAHNNKCMLKSYVDYRKPELIAG